MLRRIVCSQNVAADPRRMLVGLAGGQAGDAAVRVPVGVSAQGIARICCMCITAQHDTTPASRSSASADKARSLIHPESHQARCRKQERSRPGCVDIIPQRAPTNCLSSWEQVPMALREHGFVRVSALRCALARFGRERLLLLPLLLVPARGPAG